jgi:hypothetical protein
MSVQWILRFIPSFNLGNALFKIINIQIIEALAQQPITVWDSTGILYEVIFQANVVRCVHRACRTDRRLVYQPQVCRNLAIIYSHHHLSMVVSRQ